MEFADSVLLSTRIKERYVYADEKSVEKYNPTGVIKRKYKLFCSKLESLNIFLFFVSDGEYRFCNLDLLVWVRSEEWEQRNPKYLSGISYFDLRKSETLSADEITFKMRDSDNQFLNVAVLPTSKYDEMKTKIREGMEKPFKFGKRKNKIPQLIEGLLKEEVSEEILRKLGLQ